MVTKQGTDELVALCHAAADPALNLVIAGEGNAAVVVSDDRLLITASGSRMADCAADKLVQVDSNAIWSGLDTIEGDEAWSTLLNASCAHSASGTPSVETALHVVMSRLCDTTVTLHTHPTAVLAVLSSPHAAEFAYKRLYPDQVVLQGPLSCFVPYVDPGPALARSVRDAIRNHRDIHAAPPRVVLLENHGLIVGSNTTQGAVETTLMTVKAAEIFCGAAAIGGVRYLSSKQVQRIDGRADERYRRAMLGQL